MDLKNILSEKGQKTVKEKGEHLFHQGEADPNLYYLTKGFLKGYYISDDGKEFVKTFIVENSVIANITSIYTDGPCSYSVVCMEPCELLTIPYKVLHKACEADQALAMKIIDLLLQFAMKKERREYEFLCLSPEERYRNILENQPQLLEKITQNDLSKYLSLTPIGLSRIKKRVAKNP